MIDQRCRCVFCRWGRTSMPALRTSSSVFLSATRRCATCAANQWRTSPVSSVKVSKLPSLSATISSLVKAFDSKYVCIMFRLISFKLNIAIITIKFLRMMLCNYAMTHCYAVMDGCGWQCLCTCIIPATPCRNELGNDCAYYANLYALYASHRSLKGGKNLEVGLAHPPGIWKWCMDACRIINKLLLKKNKQKSDDVTWPRAAQHTQIKVFFFLTFYWKLFNR